jgi:hypothetical protein
VTELAPQCKWPPALPAFPANREFCKIVTSGALETLNSGGGTGHLKQIPHSLKQGFIFAEQELLTREQGILSTRIKIIAG